MYVKDIMVHGVITVKCEDTVAYALEIMNSKNINGTPVVDENMKLLGFLVKADIYRFLSSEGHYDTCPVDWVMSKDVVTVSKESTVNDAAKLMRHNDINGLPIVEDEVVIGILTFEDVIDYFLEKSN